MLRFKILASAVPLIVAAVFARGEFSIGSRPCIAIGGASIQITASPWQAQLQVSFTSDPSTATVRVQISESAGAADFAVVDDVDSAEDGACAGLWRSPQIRASPRRSSISRRTGPPIIGFSCIRSVLRHAMRRLLSSAPVAYRAGLPPRRSETP